MHAPADVQRLTDSFLNLHRVLIGPAWASEEDAVSNLAPVFAQRKQEGTPFVGCRIRVDQGKVRVGRLVDSKTGLSFHEDLVVTHLACQDARERLVKVLGEDALTALLDANNTPKHCRGPA